MISSKQVCPKPVATTNQPNFSYVPISTRLPENIMCPRCKKMNFTRINYSSGLMTWLMCASQYFRPDSINIFNLQQIGILFFQGICWAGVVFGYFSSLGLIPCPLCWIGSQFAPFLSKVFLSYIILFTLSLCRSNFVNSSFLDTKNVEHYCTNCDLKVGSSNII